MAHITAAACEENRHSTVAVSMFVLSFSSARRSKTSGSIVKDTAELSQQMPNVL